MFRSQKNFKIELSTPGFDREQIGIQFQSNHLIVIGSSERKQDEKERYLTREFGSGNFIRRFSIPGTVVSELINAAFSNGILTIILPKKVEVIENEPKDIIIN